MTTSGRRVCTLELWPGPSCVISVMTVGCLRFIIYLQQYSRARRLFSFETGKMWSKTVSLRTEKNECETATTKDSLFETGKMWAKTVSLRTDKNFKLNRRTLSSRSRWNYSEARSWATPARAGGMVCQKFSLSEHAVGDRPPQYKSYLPGLSSSYSWAGCLFGQRLYGLRPLWINWYFAQYFRIANIYHS